MILVNLIFYDSYTGNKIRSSTKNIITYTFMFLAILNILLEVIMLFREIGILLIGCFKKKSKLEKIELNQVLPSVRSPLNISEKRVRLNSIMGEGETPDEDKEEEEKCLEIHRNKVKIVSKEKTKKKPKFATVHDNSKRRGIINTSSHNSLLKVEHSPPKNVRREQER